MGRLEMAALSLWAWCALSGCVSPESRAYAQPTAEPAARPAMFVFAGGNVSQDAILERIRTARSERFQAVGTTSLVYRMELDGDIEAAFKPTTKTDGRGALSEVAAYRVARALGIDTVPPATLRRVPRSVLLNQLDPSQRRAAEAGISWDNNGSTIGAAIYWIPNMSNLQLERPSRMEKWTKRLQQDGWVPSRERDFYRDVSNMLALDYLIGNWDRFTGGNAQGTPDATRVFIRDHDFAFTSLLRFERHERVYAHLRRTEKFSRMFVNGLVTLDEARLRAELARDPLASDAPLLTDAQIAEMLDRRQTLLSYIVSLVDQYGEEKVLAFP